MKPWKRIASLSDSHSNNWLQWGHGDEAVEEAAHPAHSAAENQCFNGATAMKPWKRLGHC